MPSSGRSTDFKDDVLGRLGGTFHGTVMDYRANAAFFLAEVYWQPPEGDADRPDGARSRGPPIADGRPAANGRQGDDGGREAERRR